MSTHPHPAENRPTLSRVFQEPAGRRLDAWVALYAAGWTAHRNSLPATQHAPDFLTWEYDWVPAAFNGDVSHQQPLPRYSANAAEARALLNVLALRYPLVNPTSEYELKTTQSLTRSGSAFFFVQLQSQDPAKKLDITLTADTEALAWCQLALAWELSERPL